MLIIQHGLIRFDSISMLFVCFKMRFEYLINKLPALYCKRMRLQLIYRCTSFHHSAAAAALFYASHQICIQNPRFSFIVLNRLVAGFGHFDCVNLIWVKIQSHAGVVISILAALTFAKLSDIACET